jgi:cell division protease FtsH
MPVSKITIVPHTDGALGYTLYLPEEEKFLSTKDELLSQLRGILGGRAAEEVVFGTMTNGASNDLQKATGLARYMVCLYGMSEELGLMATAAIRNEYLDGSAQMDCSPETSAKIDAAVMKILNGCYADAKRLLTENRQLLDEIAEYLLVKETITGEELMDFIKANRDKTAEPETTEETEA